MVKCIVPIRSTFCHGGISVYVFTLVLTQELHERLYSRDSQRDTSKTKAFERLIYLFSVKTNAHTAETVQISSIQFVGRVAQPPTTRPLARPHLIQRTPPKNDLVSGGHGQAGSWRGQ